MSWKIGYEEARSKWEQMGKKLSRQPDLLLIVLLSHKSRVWSRGQSSDGKQQSCSYLVSDSFPCLTWPGLEVATGQAREPALLWVTHKGLSPSPPPCPQSETAETCCHSLISPLSAIAPRISWVTQFRLGIWLGNSMNGSRQRLHCGAVTLG